MEKKLKWVLLVDDDHATNFIHRRIIEKSNITDHIEISLNGKEALEFIENHGNIENPSIIFLDINMPVMDGWEFLESFENLKFIKKGKTIIVMMSTSFNPDDVVRAKKIALIDCYKSKPMTFDIIDEIVTKYFD